MRFYLEERTKTFPSESLNVAEVPQDIVYKVFGRELSMGKSMGLMAMVGMVAMLAKKYEEAKGVCLRCFYQILSNHLRAQKKAAYGDFVSDR